MTPPAGIRLAGCQHRLRWATPLRTWDVDLDPGQVGYLAAPNGAGKSTFLRAALDLIPARWQVHDLGAGDGRRGALRYVADPRLSPLVPLSDVLALFAARLHLGDAMSTAIETWGLGPLLDHECGALSAGQQQVAQLAIACSGTPGALLLDEPAHALDEHHRGVLLDELRRLTALGACALVVEHDGWLRAELGGKACADA